MVGFKNSPEGSIEVAVQAVVAARAPHEFLGVDQHGMTAQLSTTGNETGHVILRGDKHGPNYSAEHIATTKAALLKAGLRPAIMVDCSHSNCSKDPDRQPEIFMNVLEQFVAGESAIIGTMIESNIAGGGNTPLGAALAFISVAIIMFYLLLVRRTGALKEL